MVITQFNERWIVLGDITNSTLFFHLLDKNTNGKTAENKLLFEVTHILNSTIECIYQIVETVKPEKASLGNTMGDGFLVVGFAGHGSPHIQYEFAVMLNMCRIVKKKADEKLAETKRSILSKIKETIPEAKVSLPDLKLKLCVHLGYVLTSVGFNRYIGDCINYCARVVSSAFEGKQPDFLVLTDAYFQLLPEDLKKYVHKSTLSKKITLRKYFDKNEDTFVTIWEIPFDGAFWNIVDDYLSYYKPISGMSLLRDKLYSRENCAVNTAKISDNKA